MAASGSTTSGTSKPAAALDAFLSEVRARASCGQQHTRPGGCSQTDAHALYNYGVCDSPICSTFPLFFFPEFLI